MRHVCVALATSESAANGHQTPTAVLVSDLPPHPTPPPSLPAGSQLGSGDSGDRPGPGAGQGDGESQRLLTGEVRTGLTGTGRERRPSPRRRGQARSEPRAALWMAGEAQRRN